jgi:hypothetical protein
MPTVIHRHFANADCARVSDALSMSRLEHQPAPIKNGYRRASVDGKRGIARVLIRAKPGFYVMRLGRGRPLVPAIIYQPCPMVVPQPQLVDGPDPEDWCRPLDRSPLLRARIDGREVAVDRVWTSRSLRPVSAAEYAFRVGMLRRWARQSRQMPEARPHRAVDFASLPPLF